MVLALDTAIDNHQFKLEPWLSTNYEQSLACGVDPVQDIPTLNDATKFSI
jgi:hypothetical protein